ncbi:MAG: hypothetical protein RL398_595 [Planctomycetota bacterium]|jgi:aminopeptidase N
MPIARAGVPFAALRRIAVLVVLAAAPMPTAALLGQQPINTSGAAATPEHECWAATAYSVRLEIDPANRHMRGRAEIRAKALHGSTKVAVDLDPALVVDRVAVGERVVAHARDGGRVLIELPTAVAANEAFTVFVDYSGSPRTAVRSPWAGGIHWAKAPDGSPWIVSDCRLEGADVWMPCHDRPGARVESVRCEFVVPKGLVAVAVGKPDGERQVDGDRASFAFVAQGSVAPGDLGFCIGPFERLEQAHGSAEAAANRLAWYVLPGSAAAARRCMPQVADQLAVYESLVGARLSDDRPTALVQVPDGAGGASALLAYSGAFLDEQFDPVLNRAVAGLLVQQAIALPDWQDAWLRDGLGAYLAMLYREARFGPQAYRRDLVRWRPKNVEPLVPEGPRDARAMYLGPGRGADLTARSCWLLHTVRWQMGDEAFFAALRAGLRHDAVAPRLRTTEEFVARCSEAARRDLAPLFSAYLRSAALPRLEATRAGGRLRLQCVNPQGGFVALAVPVLLGGTEVRVELLDGRGELEVGDREHAIDPEQRVLLQRGDGVR